MQPGTQVRGVPDPEFTRAAEVTGTDQDRIALRDVYAETCFGGKDVLGVDGGAGLKPRHVEKDGEIQKHRRGHQGTKRADRTEVCTGGRHDIP
ncbi:hypothetical protein AHiyo8_03200 [Arthrobacter sp. Hiyo8]|nr:hypothetical protein AHiyo8_03200 [Arthrobacter sp. Hiyo8]